MKKVITIILDGFGIKEEEHGNAIKKANMHNFNDFYLKNPHCLLWASEERVGLLKGQMGSSEVGHMTIGAGRVLKSDMTKINEFLDSNLKEKESMVNLLKDKDRRIHLMGLCSDGNVHSNVDHFIKMYKFLVSEGFTKIYFHIITDGRDTKIDSACNYISQIEQVITENNNIGSISTICGRYYAMDRDENFDRTKKYYDLVVYGMGRTVLDVKSTIRAFYENDIYDEFMYPIINDEEGIIKDEDCLIWLNFRNDRAKQIISAFADSNFSGFEAKQFNDLDIYSFFAVDNQYKTNTFLENDIVKNSLGLYFSKLGIKQTRIAESEKFPHVTYFFDGEYDGKIEGCEKIHVPSPDVETYDMKPEMSAVGITKKAIEAMENDSEFILVNFANPDMVGHTGNMDATIKACMAVDICLGKLFETANDNFYTVFLLADHGNADTMYNEDGTCCTTHSLAKVPFVINDTSLKLKNDGDLSNVAPTILDYMNITIPDEMTSESLIIE